MSGRNYHCRICFLCLLLVITLLTVCSSTIAGNRDLSQHQKIVVVELDGVVDKGMVELLRRGLNEAAGVNSSIVVLKLNTYGGYLSSMDEIIYFIASSKKTIVAWIPPGGKAVSAGAFIALSCDKIYVGYLSTMGACRPSPEDNKTLSYAISRIKSIAEAKWSKNDARINLVVKMVTENKAYSWRELIDLKIADGIANNTEQLLGEIGCGNASIISISPGIYEQFSSLISDPSIAILLIVLGGVMIGLELVAAGFQGLGVLGLVLALVGLYGLGSIGASALVIALILAGLIFIIVELSQPGIQVFGITGLVLLAIAYFLAYYEQPYAAASIVSWISIFIIAGVIIAMFFLSIKIHEAMKKEVKGPIERVIGCRGIAKTLIEPGKVGVVYVEGEDWSATSDEHIEAGEEVEVIAVRDLTLIVRKARKT